MNVVADAPVATLQPPVRSDEARVLRALAAGFLVLAAPTLRRLATTVWASDEQSHGPVLLAAAAWLMWQQRGALLALPARPARWPSMATLLVSLLAYLVGRSQEVAQLEVGALIGVLVGLLLMLRGWAGVRGSLLPLFVLLFIVPLPGVLVQTATIPLKTAVSVAAEALLHAAGYPVARAGVILAIGQYQLLVADACAGLTSMFTLEALGLAYVQHLAGGDEPVSARHRAWLAALILPISFLANVVRVVVLVLVTYHFGDAAGQGFVHGFAGVVLFTVALLLVLATDRGLRWALGRSDRRMARAHG